MKNVIFHFSLLDFVTNKIKVLVVPTSKNNPIMTLNTIFFND